jgi:predicted transcriptional regulator
MKLMEEKGMKRVAVVKNGQLIGMLMENAANAAKRAASQVKASIS